MFIIRDKMSDLNYANSATIDEKDKIELALKYNEPILLTPNALDAIEKYDIKNYGIIYNNNIETYKNNIRQPNQRYIALDRNNKTHIVLVDDSPTLIGVDTHSRHLFIVMIYHCTIQQHHHILTTIFNKTNTYRDFSLYKEIDCRIDVMTEHDLLCEFDKIDEQNDATIKMYEFLYNDIPHMEEWTLDREDGTVLDIITYEHLNV